jgi:hypothetical protein
MEHHVFLSYSHRDMGIMRRVRDDLRAAGLTVWNDENLIPGHIILEERHRKSD